MKTKRHIAGAILVASITGLTGGTASAVTGYNPGDLILGFQDVTQTASTDRTVMVDLGQAYLYRNASKSGNIINIANTGTTLSSLLTGYFGASWYENPNIYWGIVTTPDNTGFNLYNGDPSRTAYFTKDRATGNSDVSTANSSITTPSTGTFATFANDVLSLEQSYNNNGTTNPSLYFKGNNNSWEDIVPITSDGTQSALLSQSGGISQAFGTNSYGTVGAAGAVEGALDFYRAQPVNTINGQYDQGAAYGRTPQYEGIFTIDQNANVSFIAAVPEPSSALLMASVGVLGFVVRRRRAVIS